MFRPPDRLRRRDLLQAGALAGLGLSLPNLLPAKTPAPEISCIQLILTGGPSQLDTWDMKPDAPSEVRGPFRPIPTNVPGIRISEIFPRMAKHADKYAILRGVHHTAPATHEAGLHAMQTGRLLRNDTESLPHGCALSQCTTSPGNLPTHVRLPDPAFPAPPQAHERYGRNPFGRNCLRARHLVESGVRFVTVDMFPTVFDELSWDVHGFKPFSPLSCYHDLVGPMFDMAYSSLLSDLHDRGLLKTTMVIAMGEFGRTPKINPAGGRDHWPQCSSVLMAGGPIQGGQVIGSSDRIGAEPKDRPVTPAEIAATIYHGLGLPLDAVIRNGQGQSVPLVDPGVAPVAELLG